MRKSMMQLAMMTMALISGVAAAAPPALAHGYCHWRHHRHVAAAFPHAHWTPPHWAYNGWGPGVGFEPVTGVVGAYLPIYNHPYYYGGGPYGNCEGYRLVLDAHGNVLGRQAVYVC